jgi:hypothetical protein
MNSSDNDLSPKTQEALTYIFGIHNIYDWSRRTLDYLTHDETLTPKEKVLISRVVTETSLNLTLSVKHTIELYGMYGPGVDQFLNSSFFTQSDKYHEVYEYFVRGLVNELQLHKS